MTKFFKVKSNKKVCILLKRAKVFSSNIGKTFTFGFWLVFIQCKFDGGLSQTNVITLAAMKKKLCTLCLKQGCATRGPLKVWCGPAKISSFLVIHVIHFKPGSEDFFWR